MHRFKSILVLVHGDYPSAAALGRVMVLTKQSGAALKLVGVVEPFPWYTRLLLPASEDLQHLLTRQVTDRLESLATPLRQDGIKVATEVLWGRPHLEICREVLRAGHDLAVKVAEPDRASSFGSTDMHLLRECPCPLLLLHPVRQEKPLQHIVVAVDPPLAPDVPEAFLHLREEVRPEEAALNGKLMRLATALTKVDGGRLHVVHAWSAPGEDLLRVEGRRPRREVDEYVASLHEEHRRALARLLDEHPDESARRDVHLVKGPAAEVIAEFAGTQDADLVVMGTVVRTGVPGLLFGNTAETVFHRVACSVLAAKPDTFITPIKLDESQHDS